MEYRTLGKSGIRVSALGLGTEHIEKTPEMLDRILGMAVEAGVTYVDLLYVADEYWEAYGDLYKGRRDHLAAAVHWNKPEVHDNDVNQRQFEGILSRLGNNYAEVGLVTMIESQRHWETWGREAIDRLHALKAAGRIGAVAVSGHSAPTLQMLAESGTVDALMFGINLLGRDDEAERALLEACAAHGVGLVAMKPYHGGTLLDVNGEPSGITPSQCLAYTLSVPGVVTAVPGPKNDREWSITLHFLEATDQEKDFAGVAGNLQEVLKGQCVYCMHCMPCPEELSIGWLIWFVDHARGGATEQQRNEYAGFEHKASECARCGICLERCPYGVDIMDKLDQAVALFE